MKHVSNKIESKVHSVKKINTLGLKRWNI